ncbi:MAG: TIGR04013 family B12-binding domain/radical SAM domain-containing protein [Candidatus Lokiarchaeota archaeon]|nr:TIGR04013 family B12-binding domain/radical SAM domain-containing protein [Candidatus Lokiarchaeota archaeon]
MVNYLIFYYQKDNIFSFNALAGAIESDSYLNGINISFIRKQEDLVKEIKKLVSNNINVILGLSFFTTQIWDMAELINTLRKKFARKVLIIAGGPHPTGDPLGTLNMGVDIVVIGEGEQTLIEILKKIRDKGDLKLIKGIALLDNENNIKFTGKREPIDLNQFPPLPQKNIKFGAIEITRGCPYMCFFCQTSYIFGTSPRHRNIDSICKAIEFMKKFNKNDIRFITPNAFSYGSIDGKSLNLPKLEELLVKIKTILNPKGKIFLGSFPSEVRPEHVTKKSLDLVMKYAANDNLVIGAQSGSQKILNSCNRGHNTEDVYNAVKLITNSGLKVNVDFIFGLPNETDEDVELTFSFMKKLTERGARIHAHTFMPLPKTPFAKLPVKLFTPNFKKQIELLNRRGFLYGDWKKQEKLAIKISKYLIESKLDHV